MLPGLRCAAPPPHHRSRAPSVSFPAPVCLSFFVVQAALVGHTAFVGQASRPMAASCGAGFLACGRLSSRPGHPLPTASPPPNRPAAPSGASRQACHAGGHAGRATQSRPVRELQTPSSPHACALHLNPPPPQGGASRQASHTGLSVEQAVLLATPAIHVEQAARLAMPAVPPAERHNPDLCGSSKRHPARTPARSTSSRPLFSHLRVLRVLRGLFFSVSSVVCFSPCPPCRVRCGAGFLACGRLSSRPGHPLPTALCATQCHAL